MPLAEDVEMVVAGSATPQRRRAEEVVSAVEASTVAHAAELATLVGGVTDSALAAGSGNYVAREVPDPIQGSQGSYMLSPDAVTSCMYDHRVNQHAAALASDAFDGLPMGAADRLQTTYYNELPAAHAPPPATSPPPPPAAPPPPPPDAHVLPPAAASPPYNSHTGRSTMATPIGTPTTDTARKHRAQVLEAGAPPSNVRRELLLSADHQPLSARQRSLLSAFDIPPPESNREGEARQQRARAIVDSVARAQPQRRDKDRFGVSPGQRPPVIEIEHEPANVRQMMVLERMQQVIALIEKRQEIADRRYSELRTMRQEVARLRASMQQGRYMQAQWGQYQMLAAHKQAIEQAHARQAQLETMERMAKRQKEAARAKTESELNVIREKIKECKRSKKRAEQTLEAHCDLEKARIRVEQKKLDAKCAVAIPTLNTLVRRPHPRAPSCDVGPVTLFAVRRRLRRLRAMSRC